MDLCTKQSFVVHSKVRIDYHRSIQEYYELLIRQNKAEAAVWCIGVEVEVFFFDDDDDEEEDPLLLYD